MKNKIDLVYRLIVCIVVLSGDFIAFGNSEIYREIFKYGGLASLIYFIYIVIKNSYNKGKFNGRKFD